MKKFSEIKGVVEGSTRGDTIFEVDVNTMSIKRLVVKYCYRDWQGIKTMYFCDPEQNRHFIPTNVSFVGRGIPNTMRKDRVPQRVSHYKLLSTNIADAEKLLTRIKCGKYFGNLKENDIIYAANKSNNTVVELEISEVGNDNEGIFVICTKNHGTIICRDSKYECNTSFFLDSCFYTYRTSFGCDSKLLSFHIDKKDAENVLKNYIKDKEKREDDKKKEAEKTPNGTPIRHKDNKGNELHYGDLVSYVRKGHYGHTDISFGVIVGDSDKKIRIFDEEEQIEIRTKRKKRNEDYVRRGYKIEEDDPKDGYHSLEKENILRIKEAVS
jgi:hypothetical protein